MFDEWVSQEQEERDFYLASAYEQCCFQTQAMGEAAPNQAWLLTDMDTFVRNPYYQGPPQDCPEL